MVGKLLMRGMLVGIFAGLVTFAFAKTFGEPQVAQAISFEDHEHAAAGDAPEPELVSRGTQAGLGLLTGVVSYGMAFGGLFALTFAYAYGRIGSMSERSLSAWLALAAFIAIVVVPTLKYPPNPPSVGDAETIGYRTGLFFLTLAISIAAMVLSLNVRRIVATRFGQWNGSLAGGIFFVVVVGIALSALPEINEVPAAFPAALLWKFRTVATGMQVIMWTSIGGLFGILAERTPRLSRKEGEPGYEANDLSRNFVGRSN